MKNIVTSSFTNFVTFTGVSLASYMLLLHEIYKDIYIYNLSSYYLLYNINKNIFWHQIFKWESLSKNLPELLQKNKKCILLTVFKCFTTFLSVLFLNSFIFVVHCLIFSFLATKLPDFVDVSFLSHQNSSVFLWMISCHMSLICFCFFTFSFTCQILSEVIFLQENFVVCKYFSFFIVRLIV